ncbi:hypothetical protein FIBSPDRAFT_454576 [Athelia psychrophila]|uniref:Uncharacterized protein n=1 Tax=Athelia psychrophila TaxID=1759441 RepID=A0A167UBI2_9AGAM|nr:hypothetical protein FIBSPDRAFT_454576 [Fibularhizoctonia sp. CBS 109695]
MPRSLLCFCDLLQGLYRSSQSSEFELLGERSGNIHYSSKNYEAPLFTRDAFMLVANEGVPMQYGVLGETLEICPDTSIQHRDADRRLLY